MSHYATLDDSLRKIDLGGKVYEVEVHCLCDSSDNVNYLTTLKRENTRLNAEVLRRFLEKNLENHELYACAFYRTFDLEDLVSTYLNRKSRKKQPKTIQKLFQKADQGARNYSKRIKSKIKYSGLKSLKDMRREGNTGYINGIELLLVDI